MDSTDQKPVDPLTLDVYTGAGTAEFSLYEDDGGSLAYRSGAYAWTTITLQSTTEVANKPAGDYRLTIAPASGSFDGQLEKRRYIIRVHGLLKPEKVTLKGKSLQENPNPEGAQGWNWNEQERVVVVRLTEPLSVHKRVEIGFVGAGAFADRLNLEKAIVLREQVRLIKREMKLKHLAVTGGMDIKKPPRVIRETEKVERELDEMVRNPKGTVGTSPDFEAMREHVIGAMKDRPFEAERTIPEADPLAIDSTAKSKDATFTAEEIAKISGIFAGK